MKKLLFLRVIQFFCHFARDADDNEDGYDYDGGDWRNE